MRNALLARTAQELFARASDGTDADDGANGDAGQKEIYTSWALLILIVLLIVAFFTSYVLQSKRIQAVHETVISIFAGMVVGLILSMTAESLVLDAVSFDYQFFFNLLLPPIILASGYELHQVALPSVDTYRTLANHSIFREISFAILEPFSRLLSREHLFPHWFSASYYTYGPEYLSRG